MSRIDLLLIHPGGHKQIYQSLGSELTAIEPPVWAALIATYVRSRGFRVEIVDSIAEGLEPAQVAERVSRADPALAAIMVYGHQPSASTQHMPAAGEICREIRRREPDRKILLGGTHPAALPERTLREEPVDFVCDGEGPYTILGLLQALGGKPPGDLSKVGSLWFRDGDRIRTAVPAPLIQKLDEELPEPAWDLLPMDKYRAHNWHCFGGLPRQPYASIYTTLGCPYRCSFCCIQAPFKPGEKALGIRESVNSYRAWSPATIIRQIDTLVRRYGVRNLKIIDEMFVLNPKHVLGICDAIIERGYDLNIWAYGRIDTVKEGVLPKLRKAGFRWLAIGIESASAYVRDGVDKDFGKHDIRRICDLIRKEDVYIGANFIFGLPDDDGASMQETLDMALDLCPDWANFYCAMAYPGSKLYQMALQNGTRLPDSWIGYSQHSYESLPLPTQKVSAGRVLRFRDEAFHAFFNHPRYVEYVGKRFGPDTARQVREMTCHTLPRKYID